MTLTSFLNINSGAIQSISTLVLVLITAFYAWQTYKTNKLIYKQVAPNFKLSVVGLESSLLNDAHVKKTIEGVTQAMRHTYNIRFCLSYSVSNSSASHGTIEKPSLILTCPKSQKQLVLLNRHRKGCSGSYKTGETPSEILAAQQLWEKDESIDNTIYLRPGEKKNLREVYGKFLLCDKPDDELLYFIKNPQEVVYKISYVDENNKLHTLNIEKEMIKIDKFD